MQELKLELKRMKEDRMKIEIPIGARGSRDEFSSTYKDDFLIKNGLVHIKTGYTEFKITETKKIKEFTGWLYLVNTKYGLLASMSYKDTLTYLGHGIWDLKPYKAAKSEDSDNPW